jgi:nucleotide-binding universal stress UspA family protein
MAYKDILVYVDSTAVAPACLDLAATVATAQGAHLSALHIVPPPFMTPDLGAGVPIELIQWQEDRERALAEQAEKQVIAARQRTGVAIEWRKISGEVVDAAQLHCRYADLVVIGQGGREDDESTVSDYLPESLLMGAGRPVLIVPSYGRFQSVGERVLVAWNRTRESTRAVHDALPFLTRAKAVTVLEANPTAGGAPHIAGAEIAQHLARHGVKVEVEVSVVNEVSTGSALLSRAAEIGADLLVMGAYGHSRLREYTLGGVTRHILKHMTLPVLMSH